MQYYPENSFQSNRQYLQKYTDQKKKEKFKKEKKQDVFVKHECLRVMGKC